MLLEDGISHVRDPSGVVAGPGGRAGIVPVPSRWEHDVIAAASDCLGECIFVEPDDDTIASNEADTDIEPAAVVGDGRSATTGGDRR